MKGCVGFIVKFVATLFFHVLQVLKHRIKDHEEDCRTNWVTLKHTSAEVEGVGPPVWCLDHCLAAGVEGGEISDDILREKVSPETFSDEIVWDTPPDRRR